LHFGFCVLFVSQFLSVNSNNFFIWPRRDRMLTASLWLLQRKLVAAATTAIAALGAFFRRVVTVKFAL
jgi:hypothetical protein